jgi:hypothetical protein
VNRTALFAQFAASYLARELEVRSAFVAQIAARSTNFAELISGDAARTFDMLSAIGRSAGRWNVLAPIQVA